MSNLNENEKAVNAETWEHINVVMKLLASAQIELMRRQFTHDRSKLNHPEVSTFAEFTPKLKGSTYVSNEYRGFLKDMAPALEHHYSHNRHHPEFFENCEPSKSIDNHIEMSKWATKHGQVLPDDIYGYEAITSFLQQKQKESVSSINNMNLFDLLEMFVDWFATSQRHADGDINKSIEINTERFCLSPQLVQIFKNTVPWIRNEFEGLETQKDLKP